LSIYNGIIILSTNVKEHILNAGDELIVVGYENDIVDFKKI
jgi:K+/H+ antiporter YhaU regulatory subunit KhtT